MAEPATAVLLGVIEGLTEFLPVSSTGHLVLAGALLGYDEARWAVFNIVIQLGAILAVVVLYWRRFADVLYGMARRDPAAWRFTRNVLLAFLPAAAVGLAVHRRVEVLLGKPMVVAVALVLGGIAILLVERQVKRFDVFSVEALSWRRALVIGAIQCVSMIPGVSRSGATIMGALTVGVERKTAAEFSFFLAVPTMLGASALELFKNRHAIAASGAGGGYDIAIGFVVSFLVALAVLRGFVALISRHGFKPFAWYRIAIGCVAALWLSGI